MDVIITAADRADTTKVKDALEGVGLTDANALTSIGIVTGSYDGSLDDLRAVDGVESVEVSRTVYAQEG